MGDIDIDCIICNIDPRVNNYYFFYRSSIEIRKIAFLSHGRFSFIMHTNVCDVFAPYSCTLTPLGCTLSFSLKKTYVLGFAFYSPIPKHPPCIFIVFFAFLCREPAMHPTGALVVLLYECQCSIVNITVYCLRVPFSKCCHDCPRS